MGGKKRAARLPEYADGPSRVLFGLSTREEQVLSYAAAGYIDKQIGAELGVSLNTLRTYWSRIRNKMGDAPRTALAVAYVEEVASSANSAPTEEPDCDWEIDLERDVLRRVSSRPWWLDIAVGEEVGMDEVLARFHPEDQSRVRSILVAVKRREIEYFTYSARGVTPDGVVNASSFVKVVFDDSGKPIKAVGRIAPNLDVRSPDLEHISIGYWERDLLTGEFTADAGFCTIFQIEPGPNLRERAFRRFHRDEVAHCRTFVSETVAAGRDRARRTHRLVFDDGSLQWITTDLRIVYENGVAVRALGTVMGFH